MIPALVSIAIPTYNQGPYIEDCLRSIQRQTYKDIEIIIQDSMSNDQTETICRAICAEDSRFKYFREKDEGQSDAINRSLGKAQSKYWTWICSDDFYCSTTSIEEMVLQLENRLKTSKKTVGVFGRAVYVAENGSYLAEYHTYAERIDQQVFQKMWPFSQPASLLVREVVKEVGGVVKELNLGMDLDLFIKMTSDDRYFEFVPQYVAAVRIQMNSKSIKYRTLTAVNALDLIKKHYGSIGHTWNSAFVREYSNARTEENIFSAKKFLKPVLAQLGFIQNRQSSKSEGDAALVARSGKKLIGRFVKAQLKAFICLMNGFIVTLKYKL